MMVAERHPGGSPRPFAGKSHFLFLTCGSSCTFLVLFQVHLQVHLLHLPPRSLFACRCYSNSKLFTSSIYLQQMHPEMHPKGKNKGPRRLSLQLQGPGLTKPQGPLPVGGDTTIRAWTNCGADEWGCTQTGTYITARRTALPGRAEAVGTHGVERCLPPPSLSLVKSRLHCGELSFH